MHVALVVPGGVDRGGRERVIPAVLWLVEGLAVEHRVTVVALGQEPAATRYELCGASVINVPPEQHGPHRLVRMIARAARAAGADGRPDVVHGLWASVSGLCAVAAARRFRVPSLVHVAGGELVAMPDIGYGGALGRGGRLIGSRSVRWADEVTTATDWMADHVLAATGRRPGVVPLGVDVSRFAPDPAASEPHRLVHVASLNRVKDQTTLLQAFAKVRDRFDDARLDLIGVDTLGGEMHRLATSLGCADAAEFHGFVPSDELPSFYQRAAVHVISSRHDAGPVSVLEAAACGVPTVGSRVGHIADFARGPNPLAIGVPPGDADLLAEAIIALLTDDDRRSEIGRAARDWAVNHDAAATARAFSDRYRALVAAR